MMVLIRSLLLALRIAQVRLRLLIMLLAALLVVGQWDLLRNYWDKLTRSPHPRAEGLTAETEYWCPMCPGVASDWPAKCPVCNMSLVQRKRGEAVPLPDGVLARMQISPYRMQLAGIETSPVGYRPLARTVVVGGVAQRETHSGADMLRVRAEIFEKDVPFVKQGQAVAASCDAYPGRPFTGKVQTIGAGSGTRVGSLQLMLEVNDPGRELWPGMCVTARIQVPVAQIEPFRSMARPVTDNPPGQVLAVPESAVVDTGAKRLVYVESVPGMFDSVEVVLGPRCDDFYPVVRGLEVGQRVATAGAFLIDAETRLNPSVAAGYFGAGQALPSQRPSGSPSSPPAAPDPKITKALLRLAPVDAARAARQKSCPVTGALLGSMGTPFRVRVEGKTVFLCCEGCEEEFRQHLSKYLAKQHD